jgi:cytoplasmic tRNA 2-thiolation protein 1
MCMSPLTSKMKLTGQKACALLEGLEAGLDRSALVCLPLLLSLVIMVADIQRQAQTSTSAAPAGQRTIPKFERHTQDAVEGIEKPMKAVEI